MIVVDHVSMCVFGLSFFGGEVSGLWLFSYIIYMELYVSFTFTLPLMRDLSLSSLQKAA